MFDPLCLLMKKFWLKGALVKEFIPRRKSSARIQLGHWYYKFKKLNADMLMLFLC